MKSSSFGYKGFKLHMTEKEVLWALQPTTVIMDSGLWGQVQVRKVSRPDLLCNKLQHCNLPIYFLLSNMDPLRGSLFQITETS